MSGSYDKPETVLSVITQEIHDEVSLLAVCAGHEDKSWRYSALAQDLLQWSADWILTHEELQGFNSGNGFALLSKALSRVYTSPKYEGRGEVGELLLHIILRKFLNSERAISRIFFKDAPNMTVNGFDAVHIVAAEVPDGEELELWLGESKFYVDSYSAVGAVLKELQEHLATGYLRTEFAAISDKIPSNWTHADAIKRLLAREASLDEVFERVVVPVFVTFDSSILAAHDTSSKAYKDEMAEHMKSEWASFRRRLNNVDLPREVRVHLILLPMATKKKLIDTFDERLKAWQALSGV
ncbi:DUF1837 domain-containing protein [Pseudarthrobacter oxydans]|uniref:HamA C-terminal domain-containing protein n=1 Tax=Pseudarthrobacter oxydans TaxID=1671 RepID=UPI003ECD67BD